MPGLAIYCDANGCEEYYNGAMVLPGLGLLSTNTGAHRDN